MGNDETWLDRIQDLGAWILMLGMPGLLVAVIGRLSGCW